MLQLILLMLAAAAGGAAKHACQKPAIAADTIPLAGEIVTLGVSGAQPWHSDDWDGLLANDDEAMPFAQTSPRDQPHSEKMLPPPV